MSASYWKYSGLGAVAVTSARVSLAEVMDSGCRDIHDYWNTLRGDRFAPTWKEFDLISLPPRCIRYTHIVDLSTDPFDATFRFWGTGLTDVLHFDRTGKSILTTNMGYLNEARRAQVLADQKAMTEIRAPMPFLWDASSAREYARRLIVPSIRLPLSADGERVTNVITHFDFAAQDEGAWRDIFDVQSREIK